MTDVMRARGAAFVVIGAAAMAVHGVARSTQDLDLLTVATDVLGPSFWDPLRAAGTDVEIRRGEADDPLAGVVRLRAPTEPPIDVVVGKSGWQAAIIARAIQTEIEGVRVPVAGSVGLILLKLYAAGPQDAWDIEQLLTGPDREQLVAAVDREVDVLPADSRHLWTRIRTSGEQA